ncbi:MAG: rhombosortase [Gammaproteobacteria bacterium]|nr:rhombosortase [Gammaproteobacteria bacterium]
MNLERDTADNGGPAAMLTMIGVSLAVLVMLQALPPAWQDLLRYDRPAVAGGELWRILTGNFVHLSWPHLALNGAGLGLILWIFGPDRSSLDWLLASAIAGVATSVGIFFASPDIVWMVGLSGALHGLFVLGAVGWVRRGDWLGWGLLLGVGAKILYEQLAGAMPLSPEVIGGAVLVDAHLWGACGGLLAAILEWRPWRPAGSSL